MSTLRDVPFAKMTGSGNDFVFFDARTIDRERLVLPEVIRSICNRHNGIGADGIVILEARPQATPTRHDAEIQPAQVTIAYFNSDGTPADLCGNATLCSTVMSVELGLVHGNAMQLATPAGLISSRLTDGMPEIDLQPVDQITTDLPIAPIDGEQRIGFAMAGIPHLVVLCADADAIEVTARGPHLRRHPAVGAAGANVNWVSPRADGTWRYRTFERGVEGETLACGTGAVATAILLSTWGMARSPVRILTSSGRILTVHLEHSNVGWRPTLRGEGRVVFRGVIGDLGL